MTSMATAIMEQTDPTGGGILTPTFFATIPRLLDQTPTTCATRAMSTYCSAALTMPTP